MRPLWLMESDVWGPNSESLKSELRRQGIAYSVIRHETFESGFHDRVGNHTLQENDCVIFTGTWPLWRTIQLHWPSWVPAGWCSTENLDCSVYYQALAPYLLNQNYSILTGAAAVLQQQSLFALHGRSGRIFVRPAGCVKIFTGRCVEADTFASAIAPSRYDPDTRIVVAVPQTIGREWRFVIAEHRPLVACQYYKSGSKQISRGCPDEVWQWVETVLDQTAWQPDDVFIMDVCESGGRLWVVELNGFSCSGLYDCDLSKVVAKVCELAEHTWNAKHLAA
jgi:hypothetical protein